MIAPPFVVKFHDPAAEIAVLALVLGWLSFVVIVLIGKKNQTKRNAKLNAKSRTGLFLQTIAFGLCAVWARPFFSPLFPMSKTNEEMFAAFIVVLTAISVSFCYAAARTLGKQWALDARVIEGHELIVKGPFRIVRNPIYLAMFGMNIAFYLALSRWQALPLVLIFYAAGTAIRIRTEQVLLRENFGAEFEDYARRVPAFFPRLLT